MGAEVSLATIRNGSLPAVQFDNEYLKFTQILISTPLATATTSVGSQERISNRIERSLPYSF